MPDSIRSRIVELLKTPGYRPVKPRPLAKQLNADGEHDYPIFKDALHDLEDEGVIEEASGGVVQLTTATLKKGQVVGLFSWNKKGFGFLDVREPVGHPQLFVPESYNGLRAVTGDVVKAEVVEREGRQPGDLNLGQILSIVKRAHSRIAGVLDKKNDVWFVLPQGNVFIDPILTPDAAGKYLAPGTRVIVDITRYPSETEQAQGVVSQVLGQEGEKDVDLKMVLVQSNLPEEFPEEVNDAARKAVERFDPEVERHHRLDLTNMVIATIDPDDAKDYDDAISLERDDEGNWELGVHIADVSFFVEEQGTLDVEAQHRGNSVYFPGHVVPMLPEVLSNGVCSLQEAVPRLVKSAFITLDRQFGKPVRTRFANSIIKSAKRLRYVEAQALIDKKEEIPHPSGPRTRADYDPAVLKLLDDMNHVSRLMHARRQAAGQLTLDLPKVQLVLDEVGKIKDAVPEDNSFTHTLIEMFMVEANEATGRLFYALDVPFIRRIHPEPDPDASTRLGRFTMVAGHKIPEQPTKKDLQGLLKKVEGKPEAFAINLAVLKSFARAEYSPESIGHFALSSDHYCHFTSPIRRYADLTVHRLLDAIFEKIGSYEGTYNQIVRHFEAGTQSLEGERGTIRSKQPKESAVQKALDAPSYEDLVVLGQHLSFTERRADDAERELRQVKLLELMSRHIGQEFPGVVTGITKFGLFIQLEKWLVEGLVRYPDLLNDFWEVDERAGMIRGKRTGQRIHIGDTAQVIIARVDLARRELDVSVKAIRSRGASGAPLDKRKDRPEGTGAPSRKPDGSTRRSQRSRSRDKRKEGRKDR